MSLAPEAEQRPDPPAWLTELPERIGDHPVFSGTGLYRAAGGRQSAVLVLFGPGTGSGTDLVLIERATTLRSHPGQVAFPGGGVDPEDADLVQTALREAAEEIDLAAAGVRVVGSLPTLHIPVSRYDVTPVLGWWQEPAPVRVHDPGEVAQVLQVPVAALVDPARRFRLRYRTSNFIGPAFDLGGLTLWGFTAAVVDAILDVAELSQPWDSSQVRDLGG